MIIYLADLAHTFSTKSGSLMVPLNVGYIKSYVEEKSTKDLKIKIFKDPQDLLDNIDQAPPAMLGLSNYGWNENLNLKIGSYVKQKYPKTIIISGGPNLDEDTGNRINYLKEHNYIDYYLTEGGEEPFSELIDWLDDKDKEIPKNIIFLDKNEELVNTGRRKIDKESKHIVSPYLTGNLDRFLNAGMVPLLETNRGCPFSCGFCAWGLASHSIVSKLKLENVLSEIEYIGSRTKQNNWIICDANFGILKRDVEIAKAIKNTSDKYGYPKKVIIWLSKNTTDRNLEIAEILGDMLTPVMAIQSLDEEVLVNIKRDNISAEMYYKYQKKFHDMGSTTYSDLIIPLPGETLETHYNGLRKLFDVGVDIIQNHNMRMLPGTEMNSSATRKKFNFKTRYRLIHGDSGCYKAANGEEIKSFELEESLRSTSTMSEEEVYQLREVHFLVDFMWNNQVYADLLKLTKNFKINQLDIINKFLENGKKDKNVKIFWNLFDKTAKNEWFESREEAEKFFSIKENFENLINQEYEKMNIQFSILALKDFKKSFDDVLAKTLRDFNVLPEYLIDNVTKIVFAQFPPLEAGNIELKSKINFKDIQKQNLKVKNNSSKTYNYFFHKDEKQKHITEIFTNNKKESISKILNTQNLSIRSLKRNFTIDQVA
jgi:radical SAM superfamily enzyme YgiQ (UPF0313 family)